MKIFVTKEYFDRSQRKVRELQERLAQIRNDKTAAYTEDTNTWHDNFAYEHLTREEKQTEKLVADLLADLDNMLVVPRNKPATTETVACIAGCTLPRKTRKQAYRQSVAWG